MTRARVVGLALAGLLGACAPAGTAPPSQGGIELTIYAAASLSAALAEAKTQYEAAHPGTRLVSSTDSSAALATKIEQGAPADVFLSADTANPQKLVDAGLAIGGPTKFAGNQLTIIVPTGNPAGVTSPADLAKPRLRLIGAGDAVPISKYAQQVVRNLASLPGYPPGFAASCAANVVSREENVRAVVAKIELGEGDAAIVYVTDAAASDDIESVGIPATANVRADYSGVVVKESANTGAAAAFLEWLAGSNGQAILVGFGFLPAAP